MGIRRRKGTSQLWGTWVIGCYIDLSPQELSKKFETQAKQQRQIAKAQKELEKAEVGIT